MISFNNPYLQGSIGLPGGIPIMGLPVFRRSVTEKKESDYDFSFPGLTKTNIEYLKTKTSTLSDIYNIIFSNICQNRNKDENVILRQVKAEMERKHRDYLRDFCIGDNPMHLPTNIQPPVTISATCIGHIPEIVNIAINSIDVDYILLVPGYFSIAQINNYIAPHVAILTPHELQFLTGVIHGSIKMALRSTHRNPNQENLYNGYYGLLPTMNTYNNTTQTIITHFGFVAAITGNPYAGGGGDRPAGAAVRQYNISIPNIETQILSEANRIANISNIVHGIDSTTIKIITIGIAVGYTSIAQGYGSGLQTPAVVPVANVAPLPHVAQHNDIFATAQRLTTNLINAILPPQPNQPGNCITPMFSDYKLLQFIQKIKDSSTKLAVVCSKDIKTDIQVGGNYNRDYLFIDVLKLLQDKTSEQSEQEFVCRKSGHGYYCEMKNGNKKCDFCIKWSRDRRKFREVLVEILNCNDFLSNQTLDMMEDSVELLPASLFEQDQYVKFNQSLIDYKAMKKQNRINHGFK